MAADVFAPLRTRLNPANDCVRRKYFPLGTSTDATIPAVIPASMSVGFR
jgi:hypothetical protein